MMFVPCLRIHIISVLIPLSGILACQGAQPIKPPEFEYDSLADRFFSTNLQDHFPLTIQRGANLQGASAAGKYLFYTSNRDGSGDIWMRDLGNTVNLPVVRHPAEQKDPTVSLDGTLLSFISQDRDSHGDLMLVPVHPADIIQDSIQGILPRDHWDDAINLSLLIENNMQTAAVQCRGQAAESEPIWSSDGSLLAFVSDRCSPGISNIWLLQLEDLEIVKGPIMLTAGGGQQPVFSRDSSRMLFLSFRDAGPGGRIYELNLNGRLGQSIAPGTDDGARLVRLPAAKNAEPYLYGSPALSPDNKHLFYQSVRKDSNGNGRLDPDDHAGIYRVELGYTSAGGIIVGRERQLLEDQHSILDIHFADFVGGAIVYSAELFNSVNIYFIKQDGVIPHQPDIDAQYRFVERYRNARSIRYNLALDAVREFFGDQPEYAIYEGRILIDKIDYFRHSRNKPALKQVGAEMRAAREHNSFIDLQLQLYSGGKISARALDLLQTYLKKFKGNPDFELDPEEANRYSMTLLLLAEQHERQGNLATALVDIKLLNQNQPDFFLKNRALLLQARLQTRITKQISPIYNNLLENPAQQAALGDTIHTQLIGYFYKDRAAQEAIDLSVAELKRVKFSASLTTNLQYIQARSLFDQGKYAEALKICETLLSQIPMEQHSNRLLPRAGWGSLYIRGWQLVARLQSRLGNASASYIARLTYGGAYEVSNEVEAETDDFLQIIEESDHYIQLYLRAARLISRRVDEKEAMLVSRNLLDKTLQNMDEELVTLPGFSLDVLQEFCQPSSRNSALFMGLGPQAVQRYQKFCKKQSEGLRQRGLTAFQLLDAREAADLLYTVSYANANLINILFFYIKKLDMLPKIYARRAVHYHRLKIDVARERHERRQKSSSWKFFLLDQEELISLVAERDPFESEIYDQLEHGYRLNLAENKGAGDVAMLYGHAYILITRARQREAYYDALQEKGVTFSPEFLRKTKEEILQDFKNAEYLLQYIMYIDPRTADAYLLTGWMYQYLDERRSRVLRLQSGYIEWLVEYISNTAQVTLDGVHYSDFYATYFNFNFYEENIELYRQALDKVESDIAHPFARADIHLNLANNYFRLMDFNRAIESYKIVQKINKNHPGDNFANYRQAALFHLNLGRAYFYEGRSTEAAVQLLRAYRIYDREERVPLQDDWNNHMRALQSAGEKGAVNFALRTRQLKDRKRKVLNRMALLSALVGLANWDSGRPQEAILFYRETETRLNQLIDPDDEKAELQTSIDRANLYNFIAMAYQSNRQFRESDKSATEAGRLARDRSLTRPEDRFLPHTIGGKLLGCILDYGEDFSVGGEGRNPYGFVPLRQYELSLGIQFENRVLQGDLDGATYLMRQRRQIFQTRDSDRQLGRQGFVAMLSQEGLLSYRSGRYERAIELFLKAENAAREKDFLESYRRNFANRFYAFFARLEKGDGTLAENPQQALEEIERYQTDLISFREGYREETLQDYIRQREAEYPDYTYDPAVEDAIVDRIVRQQLVDIRRLQAGLYYYQGRSLLKNLNDINSQQEAHDFFRKAFQQYNLAVVALEKSPRNTGMRSRMRLRLNRARAALAAGNLRLAGLESTRIAEEAFEFNMLQEKLMAHFLSLEVLQERKASKSQLRPHLNAMLDILQNYPEHIQGHAVYLDDLLDTLAASLADAGRQSDALRSLEWKWEYRLHQEYFRFPLKFYDAELQKQYQALRQGERQLQRLVQDESRLRVQRREVSKIIASQKKIRKKLKYHRNRLVNFYPQHRPFVRLTRSVAEVQPSLQPGQMVMRFHQDNSNLRLWCQHRGGMRLIKKPRPVSRQTQQLILQSVLKSCLGKVSLRDIFIVRDFHMRDDNVLQAFHDVAAGQPRPVFLPRLNIKMIGLVDSPDEVRKLERLHVMHVSRVAEARNYTSRQENADVLLIKREEDSPVAPPFTDEVHDVFNPREWLLHPGSSSLIIVQNAPTGIQRGYLFEILRMQGAGSVAFQTDTNDTTYKRLLQLRGKGSYAEAGTIIYGVPGFKSRLLKSELRKKFIVRLLMGKAAEARGQFSEALEQYQVARSYLWQYVDSGKLNFRYDLAALRVGIKLHISGDLEDSIKAVLKLYPLESQKDSRERLLYMIVETLYLGGYEELGDKYYTEYARAFPDRQQTLLGRVEVVRFLLQIQSSNFLGQNISPLNLSTRFWLMLPSLVKEKNRYHIFEDLWKHALYEQARSYVEALQGAGRSFGNQKSELVQMKYDSDLLQSHARLPREYASMPVTSIPGILRQLEKKSALPEVEEISLQLTQQYPEANQDAAVRRLRANLYRQLLMHARGEMTQPVELTDQMADDSRPVYQHLEPLERSLLMRLLLEQEELDTQTIVAPMLIDLVQKEARFASYARAARMALLICDYFLHRFRFEDTDQFLVLYKKYRSAGVNDVELEKKSRKIAAMLALRPGKKSSASFKGEAAYQKLLQVQLRSFRPAEIEAFNTTVQTLISQNDVVDRKQNIENILISVRLAKLYARKSSDWKILLDLDIFEQALREFSVADEAGAAPDPARLKFQLLTRQLIQNLPTGQIMLALVPTGEKSIRVVYRDRVLFADELPGGGPVLEARMRRWLHQSDSIIKPAVTRQLSRLYHSLFGVGEKRLVYYWLSGIHHLAPIIPGRNDRHFQMVSPENMLKLPAYRTGFEFKKGLSVKKFENASGICTDSIRQADLLQNNRLQSMEDFVLRTLPEENATILHNRSALYPCQTIRQLRAQLSTPPVHLSNTLLVLPRSLFHLKPYTAIRNWNYLRYWMHNHWQGPALINVYLPRGVAHAYFMNEFYNKSLNISSLNQRFIVAYLSAMRTAGQRGFVPGVYRLTTNQWITEK